MNNEDKILQVLEQISGRLDTLEKGQAAMQEDIAEIKEHTEVTRSATNSLVKWADEVSSITKIKYPVE